MVYGKSFFDILTKNKEKACKKIIEMETNMQIKLANPDLKQQINIIDKRDRDNKATMFFIIEKLKGAAFDF